MKQGDAIEPIVASLDLDFGREHDHARVGMRKNSAAWALRRCIQANSRILMPAMPARARARTRCQPRK